MVAVWVFLCAPIITICTGIDENNAFCFCLAIHIVLKDDDSY